MRILTYISLLIGFWAMQMVSIPSSYASDAKQEIQLDVFKPLAKSRDLDTVSLHILDKISENKGRSVYRGFTITRAQGDIVPNRQTQSQESSATGLGPTYMIRNEKFRSGKLSAAIDMSGSFIIYNKKFPVGGEFYNFLWRIGPQFTYQFTSDSSLQLGYMFMHVSNGLHSEVHNPSYNATGPSLRLATKF